MTRSKWRLAVMVILFLFLLSGCKPLNQWLPRLPQPQLPAATLITDHKGRVIGQIYEQKRYPVKLKDISPYVLQAVIAAEDRDFYLHQGLDPAGIIRAIWHNLRAGRIVEGGSTISQQTVKNLFLSQERTWKRKLLEAWWVIQLEQQYTKDEILELYLNSVYFGEGAYGIEAAAQTYFGKRAKDLNLAESALLAATLKAPSRVNPWANLEATKKRQRYVLQQMVEMKVITPEQARQAEEQPLQIRKKQRAVSSLAPYFLDLVKQQAEKQVDQETLLAGGLKIETTLDAEIQQVVNDRVQTYLQKYPGLQVAVIVLENDSGAVRALTGGRDWWQSSYNRVLARRQPGSAFKSFLYALALEQGMQANSLYKCEPVNFQGYQPQDYGRPGYHGRELTMAEAVWVSDNIIPVKILAQYGPEQLVKEAKKFGFTSPLPPVLSLALGSGEVTPWEMAAAYRVFPGKGQYIEPWYISRIVTGTGTNLWQGQPRRWQALGPELAFQLLDMMRGVTGPQGTAARISQIIRNQAVAGKTGTTQENRDAWFAGFNSKYTVVVWLGYDLKGKGVGTGGKMAAPLWAEIVNSPALRGEMEFNVPGNIVKEKVCLDSGQKAGPACERTAELAFEQGKEPQEYCALHWFVPFINLPGF
ncbi:transglycosylase domain-containing protein [Carboxydocella sp. ULO1]|uniref:transglycosylase domain-containing protein n=1 Tax=Carboxydocella sp. ULO1 TaxID=1926599 RepID=UPI0009AC5213|nr:transglycosylase domain-containing protein [Carboxydocella sp. ULO1]GAW30009.1 penicillin-binding protein [Carboxydocella sp. ULO1]